jgi:hypothetical protein
MAFPMQTIPTPLTDLSKRVGEARGLILTVLSERLGAVELGYDFHREWNGCWKATVEISGATSGRLEFTLLQTPGGAMLALPRPMPERWRTGTGIPAADGSRWTLDDSGQLLQLGQG